MQEYNQAISNVVYTNGFFDPFRYFGRLYDTSGLGTVVNMDCKRYSSCEFQRNFNSFQFCTVAAMSADLRSLSVNDPTSIYEGKEQVIELVTRWSDMSPPTAQTGTIPPPTGRHARVPSA